jgi:hypothetical protein
MKFLDNVYLSEFQSFLPIQLDGTCNGFQHLSLLSEEVDLFEQLNLSESNKFDDPKDFYSFMLDKVKAYLLNLILNNKITLFDKQHILRLLVFKFIRKHIKNMIMTKPYNATDYRLVTNLTNLLIFRGTALLDKGTNKFKEFMFKNSEIKTTITDTKEPLITDNDESVDTNLDKEEVDEYEDEQGDKIINIYSSCKDSIDFVTRADLRYFIASFNHVLYEKYPHIKALITYLKDIASIFNKLNLPII